MSVLKHKTCSNIGLEPPVRSLAPDVKTANVGVGLARAAAQQQTRQQEHAGEQVGKSLLLELHVFKYKGF